MSKPSYNIHLKGYVGGADFDRNAVDAMFAANSSKPVNVLIDSLGGSLATGLSISAAFKQHGNVAVHFVDLNASAATIASLGAAHISIDVCPIYLCINALWLSSNGAISTATNLQRSLPTVRRLRPTLTSSTLMSPNSTPGSAANRVQICWHL